jgi:hypothetical protein
MMNDPLRPVNASAPHRKTGYMTWRPVERIVLRHGAPCPPCHMYVERSGTPIATSQDEIKSAVNEVNTI